MTLHRISKLTPLTWPWAYVNATSTLVKPPRLPVARFNALQFKLQAEGFKTISQISEAYGVSVSTLYRWDGVHFPKLERIKGIRVVRPEQLQDIIEQCRKRRQAE